MDGWQTLRFRSGVRRLALLALIASAAAITAAAPAADASVRLVGTWHGITGQYKTIQGAVRAAKPGDWVLVAPGDYKEKGYPKEPEPAGVLMTKPNVHLRGMDRNTVIVDGTKRKTAPCSSRPADQGQLNRDGVEVYKANNTWIENLTVCNFLNGGGGEGNQIWWNGGDGTGTLGLNGLWGNYLTATSTYSSTVANELGPCCGVHYPAGDYGIFTSNSSNGFVKNSYASNMADSGYYIGACQQACEQTLQNDVGESSALCLSSTNAGGYLLVEEMECDNNKSGLVSNSQNNDDFPSPQIGLCPEGQTGALGTQSCTVWMNNNIHDNNNPNVPGNGAGLAGGAPVGTGMILAGSTHITLSGNTVTKNGSWGELIADLPDEESPPPNNPNPCAGGTYVPIEGNEVCYFPAFGNVSENNTFSGNGFFANPTNGDIGLATIAHEPGNCFSGDTVPDGTDPALIESNPLYAPTNGMCTTPNSGDEAAVAAEANCAGSLLAECPGAPGAEYPRPTPPFTLPAVPSNLASMPEPCLGVPSNPWCP